MACFERRRERPVRQGIPSWVCRLRAPAERP